MYTRLTTPFVAFVPGDDEGSLAAPAARPYYRRVMLLLSELATSPDSEVFATDIHMLTVLVNDAATHGAATEVDGRSFEEQLITLFQGGDIFLHKLLAGLSGYDAVAAFRVARACGLAPLDQAPDFVRSGFEQPAFMLFALEQMREDGDHRGLWISLALEASLAFPAANQIFRHTPVPEKLTSISMLMKRKSWTEYLGDNLLGWLFDQAYYDPSVRKTDMVDKLRHLPKPSRFINLTKTASFTLKIKMTFLLMPIYGLSFLLISLLDPTSFKNWLEYFF